MANELIDSVQRRITTLQKDSGLSLPPNYSVSNALNYAWLQLTDSSNGQSLIEKTTPESQAKALLNMVIQGLSPAKNQVYFIPYGRTLSLSRSYFGSVAILKRLENVKDVWAEVVHEDDVIQIGSERGRTVVTDFEPRIENQDKPITAAFAVIEDTEGTLSYTVMTKAEIDKSWAQSRNHKVQNDFPGEMAKRTVLNRAAKFFINSSSDNDLLLGSINETTAGEYANERKDVTETPDLSDLLDKPAATPEQVGTAPIKQVEEAQPEVTNNDQPEEPIEPEQSESTESDIEQGDMFKQSYGVE